MCTPERQIDLGFYEKGEIPLRSVDYIVRAVRQLRADICPAICALQSWLQQLHESHRAVSPDNAKARAYKAALEATVDGFDAFLAVLKEGFDPLFTVNVADTGTGWACERDDMCGRGWR